MNELNGWMKEWMNEWMVTLSKTEETHQTKWNDSQPASQTTGNAIGETK